MKLKEIDPFIIKFMLCLWHKILLKCNVRKCVNGLEDIVSIRSSQMDIVAGPMNLWVRVVAPLRWVIRGVSVGTSNSISFKISCHKMHEIYN